ncbi:MAG TPA: DUF5990 family protein [Streptosporangiaceae bacterium]|nr:DUF5990 family protein [Streptosporangiaceae bacterium]
MPQLPAHPHLDQLRRQARELHRAAAAGDESALQRLRAAAADTNSGPVTLSAAQLALAREYGFASWPRLKDEVERRHAAEAPDRTGAPAQVPVPVAEPGDGDADELIAGQYADRPHLRPVLDAVLAAAPALGPLTVVARRTCVSLLSAGRTFAVVQPTAKSRVDLGFRLEGTEPGGRLRVARNIGSGTINLRIALTAPGEVDDEVIGWLRRAYEQSVAPPAPRQPARRPAPVVGEMTVRIDGTDLPGLTCQPEPDGPAHRNIHVALHGKSQDRSALLMPGQPWLATEPAPADVPSVRWEVLVKVRRGEDGFDFGGPFVRGDRTDRHLGLAWGDVPGDGTLRLFRGAKLRLVDVDPSLIEQALRPGLRLVARVRLTDAKGNPICARLHPPYLTWTTEAADR